MPERPEHPDAQRRRERAVWALQPGQCEPSPPALLVDPAGEEIAIEEHRRRGRRIDGDAQLSLGAGFGAEQARHRDAQELNRRNRKQREEIPDDVSARRRQRSGVPAEPGDSGKAARDAEGRQKREHAPEHDQRRAERGVSQPAGEQHQRRAGQKPGDEKAHPVRGALSALVPGVRKRRDDHGRERRRERGQRAQDATNRHVLRKDPQNKKQGGPREHVRDREVCRDRVTGCPLPKPVRAASQAGRCDPGLADERARAESLPPSARIIPRSGSSPERTPKGHAPIDHRERPAVRAGHNRPKKTSCEPFRRAVRPDGRRRRPRGRRLEWLGHHALSSCAGNRCLPADAI